MTIASPDRPRTARSGGALDSSRLEPTDVRLFRWYGAVLGVLLAAYLFFDRGIAYLHLPGTFLYIGELTLCLGLVAIAFGTGWVGRGMGGDALVSVVVCFMAWGLIRTVPLISTYGITNVFHDAALWYYGLFAILFVSAAAAVPELPARLVRGFGRIVPWLSLWLPIALLLVAKGVRGPSLTGVPIFSHKGGNIAVVAASIVAYLWLVPDERRGRLQRSALIALNLFTIVADATQTRGGTLAAAVALLVAVILVDANRRARALTRVLLVLILVVALFGATGATIRTHKRTISLSSIFTTYGSVVGAGAGATGTKGNGSGTITWREELWGNILSREVSSGRILDGFGFGPNLASIGGVSLSQAQAGVNGKSSSTELRSAHNSHMDVLGRMGIIGAFLWVLMWGGWLWRMLRVRRRYKAEGDEANRSLAELCVVVIVAIMVNAFFDPTMEGAQVAAFAFSIFGLGIVLSRRPILPTGATVEAEPSVPSIATNRNRPALGSR